MLPIFGIDLGISDRFFRGEECGEFAYQSSQNHLFEPNDQLTPLGLRDPFWRGTTAALPDFYIGANAAVRGMTVPTRDTHQDRTSFSRLELISPEKSRATVKNE